MSLRERATTDLQLPGWLTVHLPPNTNVGHDRIDTTILDVSQIDPANTGAMVDAESSMEKNAMGPQKGAL